MVMTVLQFRVAVVAEEEVAEEEVLMFHHQVRQVHLLRLQPQLLQDSWL